MTLKYVSKKLVGTERGAKIWGDVTHWASHVPDDTPLDQVVDANFNAILSGVASHNKAKPPAVRGKYLEMCIYDFLSRYVESRGLSHEDHIEVHVDMKDGKHAEADFLVCGNLAVMVKVSLRERWKQIDRDSLVMQGMRGRRGRRVLSLFFAEHDTDSFRQARKKAANVTDQSYADIITVSVKDYEYMKDRALVELESIVDEYLEAVK